MKKCLLCLLCLCLVLPMSLISCGNEPWTVSRYLNVSQVGEDYVIGHMEGEGTVKVMCDARGEGYEVDDVLKIHYRVSKLKETDSTDNPVSYDFVLTEAIAISEESFD